MTNIRVSAQAFLQEIEGWKVTLNRQAQRLKQLKCNVRNKFKLNSIDIVLTEMEAVHIKYKKIKTKYQHFTQNKNQSLPLPIQNQRLLSDELLNQYSQLSKIFMQILQKVSLIEEESDEPNFLVGNKGQEQKNDDETRKKCHSVFNNNNQGDRTFLNETFAFKVSKDQKGKNNKSIFQKRKMNKQGQVGLISNTGRMKTHSMTRKTHDVSNITMRSQHNTKQRQKPNITKPSQAQSSQQFDNQNSYLWQIRHQLQTITQMMKQMKSQIQFHEHEETNREINKIETKNRKMAAELKSIREENRVILEKIGQLKKDLMEEKKAQVDMFNRFEKRTGGSKFNLYDSIATHADNYASVEGDKSALSNRNNSQFAEKQFYTQYRYSVSDWVKMRI